MNNEEEKALRIKKRKRKEKLMFFGCIFFMCLSVALMIVYFVTKDSTKVVTIDEESKERVYGVIIDGDTSVARHAGLQESYINYEMLGNDGQTKILALYKDRKSAIIGPVTSLDHYFLDIAKEHAAIVTSYGVSNYADELVKENKYETINGKVYPQAFMQDKKIPSHNIYTDSDKMEKVAKEKNYDKKASSWEVFKYSSSEVSFADDKDSKKATYINIKYNTNETREYKYDNVSHSYLRLNNGLKDIDRQTEEQLSFKNIIIIYLKANTITDDNILDFNLVGEGEGYYITNGYMKTIKWKKSSKKSKTKYTYKDGKELELNDGNTIVQIVPKESE